MSTERPPYWVDHLEEKHECFSYGEATTIVIEHNERSLRVIVPAGSASVMPLVVAEADGVLTVVGRLDKQWNDKPLGILLVAKKRGDNEYEVGVWHELYPWALKHLGLALPAE